MTHQGDYTLPQDLAEKGLETVPELLRVLINQAMQAERAKYLIAGQYERTEDRKGHANGYKPKTVRTTRTLTPHQRPRSWITSRIH